MTLFMVRLMDSTPPATMMSLQPEAIWLAAMAIACRPEEQNRLRVMPAVPMPRRESTATLRPILKPWAPSLEPAPTMQSSTLAGSIPVRANSASTQCAAMSSGRVMLNLPRKDLARPVRTLSTITTSRMAYLIVVIG
ncbi:hypothetical protein D3C73_1130360 [compost metagenome]